MERRSDGGEEQGAAEEAFMGQKKAMNRHVSIVKEQRLCEWLFLFEHSSRAPTAVSF